MGILSKQGISLGIAFAGINMAVNAAMGAFNSLQSYIGESIQSFREFERGISNIGTLLDNEERPILHKLREDITTLSIQYAQSIEDMTGATYQLISAGVDSSKAMLVLENSARLATIGLSTTEEAVNTTTGILNAYNMSVYESEAVTDKLMKTVELGKTTMSELSNALGYVVSTAAGFGVSIDEVLTDMVELTKRNIDSTKAARAYRMVIANLGSPTEEARSTAQSLGFAYDDLTLKMLGVNETLKTMTMATEGNTQYIRDMVGDINSLNAVLALTKSDTIEQTFEEIRDSIGTTREKMREYASDPLFIKEQFDAMRASYQVELGKLLEPGARELEKGTDKLLYIFSSIMGSKGISEMGEDWNKLRETVEKTKKQFDVDWNEKNIASLAGYFSELNRIVIDTQETYDQVNDRIRKHNIEIGDLNAQIAELGEINDYSEAIRGIGLALESSSYSHLIFDNSIQALVDSIRMQRNEIKELNKVNNQYSMMTRANSIEVMKIQLSAMGRRGRMTRTEKRYIKELEKEDLKHRILSTKNQLEIDRIKNTGLTEEEERLKHTVLAYQDKLHSIRDVYGKEVQALQDSIDWKETLNQKYLDALGSYDDSSSFLGRGYTAYEVYYDNLSNLAASTANEITKMMGLPGAPTYGPSYGEYASAYYEAHPGWKGPLKPPGYQMGTPYVPRTGPYMLHEGERVIPKAQNTGQVYPSQVKVNANISVTIRDISDTYKLAQKLELAIQQGLISGITTSFR
jgi:TP901 family phage tail tape measure protein